MNLIFEHDDGDGDRIKIREYLDYLIVKSEDSSDGAEVDVRLHHDRVAALHATLGEWLGRTTAPIAPNSLIDQLIVKRVAEEVARVLPLHLSPLAFKSDAERAREEADGLWRKPGDCGTDPQHAKYEDAGAHPYAPKCSNCTHEYEDHVAHSHGMAEECVGTPRCTCTRYRSARVQVPVEDAHSPLCGQCGQLWTDTHGQPGYPCVRKGDKVWGIDGLPSMEPYCTGCTHSWSRHVGAGGCGASMFGTTRLVCGCKRVQS